MYIVKVVTEEETISASGDYFTILPNEVYLERGGTAERATLKIPESAEVYVMNGQGETVDTVI